MRIRALDSGCALALALAAGLVALTLVAPFEASAAQPVRGARYVDTDYGFWVYLRVSTSGRAFSVRRSLVENSSDWDCRGLNFHLGTRSRPVRISRSGRFRYVRRRGRFVLRVVGRFVTKDRAKITFRYRRHPRRRGHRCDDSGRISLSPRRPVPTPFTDCRTHKARTILSTPAGRVFWEPKWDNRGGDGWMTVAYACLFSVNRRFELAQDDDDDSDLDLFRLVEPYVAYALSACPMGCAYGVDVYDLRTGRGQFLPPSSRIDYFGRVTDLVLKANGSVAWIAGATQTSGPRPSSVFANDAGGYRRIDTGRIELKSLELRDSTLTWVKDGVTQTATLE
jgi:hypothetical protein